MRTKRFSLLDLDRQAAPEQGGSTNGQALRGAGRLLRYVVENELTPRQRQCVQLCLMEGLTLGEAGQRLGLNPTTVWRHLERARKRLRAAVRLGGLARFLGP